MICQLYISQVITAHNTSVKPGGSVETRTGDGEGDVVSWSVVDRKVMAGLAELRTIVILCSGVRCGVLSAACALHSKTYYHHAQL